VIEKRGLRGNLSTILGALAFALGLAAGAGFSGALPVGAEPPGPIRKDTGPAITPLPQLPDLAISIVASPNPVAGGAPLLYTLTVNNIGGANATGVKVRHTLPADSLFVKGEVSAGSGFSCGHASGVVTCVGGSIPARGLGVILIDTRAPLRAGSLVSTAVVDPVAGEISTANNSRSFSITSLGAPDLIPIASGTPWFVSTGGLPNILLIPNPNYKEFRGVTLHLSVKNQGTGFSPATTLRIQLLSSSVARFMRDDEKGLTCPLFFQFVDGSCVRQNENSPASCSHSQGSVTTCSIPSLTPGATSGQSVANVSVTISAANLPITFYVRADADGAVTESNENNNMLPVTVTVP